MRDHRITKSVFRPCSTCLSRSQAPFCLCTLRMISNHSEGTFERFRYALRADRTSQTVHLTLSPARVTGAGSILNITRAVSHHCLRLACHRCFIGSHLSCTGEVQIQYQVTVKLHGVFPSCRG